MNRNTIMIGSAILLTALVFSLFSVPMLTSAQDGGIVITATPNQTQVAEMTQTPQVTIVPFGAQAATPVATQALTVLDPTNWEYFSRFATGFTNVEWHGALIDRLDALYLGVERQLNGGTVTTGATEVVILWTGDYLSADPTQGGLLTPFLVDGDTGVWMVRPNTTVTVPTGFAMIRLNGWNGETEPRTGTPALARSIVEAQDSIGNSTVLPVITQHTGSDRLFAELDDIANANPDARIRSGWYSQVNAHAGRTLVWTRCDQVSLGWALVSESDNKCLYVATVAGSLEVMYPFSGIELADAYPNYSDLPHVTASAAPSVQTTCVPNQILTDLVNEYRQSDELYLQLALLPVAVHPSGSYTTLWNTFTVTMSEVGGTNQLPIDWFVTQDGFRALYFTMTDGFSSFAGWSATITPCGVFSPADAFPTWWGQ